MTIEEQAEALAEKVYASDDCVHQDDNISWSRKLQTLVVEQDGGGLIEIVDITSISDETLNGLADLDGEHTMHALEGYTIWSEE